MGVEQIALALNHSQAKGNARLVLLGIANQDGDGGSWPSVATLARYANVSIRTVQRALEELVDLGEVEVFYNDGGTHHTRNDQRPNRYVVKLACPPGCDGTTNHRTRGDSGVTPMGYGVTDPVERGDTTVANGVTPLSPEPSLEPSLEPSSTSKADEPAVRDDVERLCQHLSDRIVRNGSKAPTVTKAWRDAARLMLDRDQRTEKQIHAAIDWCQDDEFWRSNILSMPKLRTKYDQLRLAAERQRTRRPAVGYGDDARTGPPPKAMTVDEWAASDRKAAGW